MKTILQFVHSLKCDKSDEAVLLRHIEELHASASGPSLDERRYLKSKPVPADLSWKGNIVLEDALNAGKLFNASNSFNVLALSDKPGKECGFPLLHKAWNLLWEDHSFTSKQAYKMGIPSIGIVAVLVANVTFIAWATPPGGPSPYWLGCDYPMFTGFLIVNGIAFVLAVASAVVVTAFPLVLSRTPHQAAWWGGVLLMLSMLAFIVAFLMAGFVTVGYSAPPPSCSSLRCTEGGIACDFQLQPYSYDADGNVVSVIFLMDQNVAELNALSNSSSAAVCVTYNQIAQHATNSTLMPWLPDVNWTNSNASASPEATEAISRLLQDPVLQAETVCLDATNLPTAIDPQADPETLAVNVTGLPDIPDLGQFLTANEITVYDLLPNNSFTQLLPYSSLNYFCLSRETEEIMKFDVLCDASVQTSAGNLSVSKTGEYIRAVTAADSGAVLFDTDVTAQQVSKAIKALAGVFSFILVVIVVFLIKSKWF